MTDFSNSTIIELAAVIASHLGKKDIKIVLVGGLAVEFYSNNIYLTNGIDMVNTCYQSPKALNEAMAELGFSKVGRVYINNTTAISVEFPSAPLVVGNDFVNEVTTISVGNSEIPILHAIDVVKDRLAAYFHWNDRPSLAQALTVMLCHAIKPVEIKPFCVSEMKVEEFPFIEMLHNMSEKQHFKSMEEIENLVLHEYLKR